MVVGMDVLIVVVQHDWRILGGHAVNIRGITALCLSDVRSILQGRDLENSYKHINDIRTVVAGGTG